MRIYNATDSQISLPLIGSMRINIAPHSVSTDFLGGTEFLSMLVTSYDTTEIALIVAGPYELNTCANIPTATNYVVQTLEEALTRFGQNKAKKEEKKEETDLAAGKDDVIEEKPVTDEKDEVIVTDENNTVDNEVVVPEEVVPAKKPKKKSTKKKKEE